MRDFTFNYRNHTIRIQETNCNDFIISINGEYNSNVETNGKIRVAKSNARKKVDEMIKNK